MYLFTEFGATNMVLQYLPNGVWPHFYARILRKKTRMHSSRMRTDRSLTLCWHLLLGGGCSGGVCLVLEGCLLRGGVCSQGGVSAPGGVSASGGVSALGGEGGGCSWGVSAPRGCLLPGWGVCFGGSLLRGGPLLWGDGIPACTEADTLPPPCGQNHRRL